MNMYIVKSLCVLLLLIILVILSLYNAQKCYSSYKRQTLFFRKALLTGLLCVITLVSIFRLGEYVYPFDKSVDFELYATLVIPPENTLHGPNFWHSAYDDIQGDESFFFNPDEKYSHLGFEWPAMDFEHHTYIITYGQELESLSYNVWDYVKYPFYTGVKIGHATLNDEFDPNTVYVFEIPRIRIDNDP